MQVGRLPSAVADGDLNQQIFRRFFRIFDEHVEIAVLVEHAGVEQFVLEFIAPAAAAGVDKVGVRERRLRILVQVFHVRVGRRAVEIEIVFLDVSPWLLSLLVSPNRRSLRIGSLPFHNATAKQSR